MTPVQGPVLGIPEIDASHGEILQLAEDLAAAARARKVRPAVAALDALIEKVALHFAAENDWMDRTAYPERFAHRSAHDIYLQDLATMGQELRVMGVTPRVVEWATRRCSQWFRFHIDKNDLPFVLHVQRRTRHPLPAPQPQRS